MSTIQKFFQLKLMLIVTLLFTACGVFSKWFGDEERKDKIDVSELRKGQDLIGGGKSEEGLKHIEKFLKEYPLTKYTPLATFEMGLAYENLEKPKKACKSFNRVIKARSPENPDKLVAQSLYHRGICLDELGDDSASIASFLDSEKLKHLLPSEVARVEVPARLAGAYARLGEHAAADKYFALAEKELATLRAIKGGKMKEWLPKVTFNIGAAYVPKLDAEDYITGIQPLAKAQEFLYRSAELGHPKWSPLAAKTIRRAYDKSWQTINDLPLAKGEDKIHAMKLQQEKMIEMGTALRGVLRKLELLRLTEQDEENIHVKNIFLMAEEYDKKLLALLEARPIGEGLTPAAQKREGIKREGRVIDPSGKLERGKKRLPEKLPGKKK